MRFPAEFPPRFTDVGNHIHHFLRARGPGGNDWFRNRGRSENRLNGFTYAQGISSAGVEGTADLLLPGREQQCDKIVDVEEIPARAKIAEFDRHLGLVKRLLYD